MPVNSQVANAPDNLGDSGTEIEVTWWCDPTPLGLRRARNKVATAVRTALDAEDIEIPVPYRLLTFKQPLSLAREHVPENEC